MQPLRTIVTGAMGVAACATACAQAPESAQPRPLVIRQTEPATNWERDGLPIGDGSLGVVVLGGPGEGRLQFTVDSLWTGDENPSGRYNYDGDRGHFEGMGSFQPLGELTLRGQGVVPPSVPVQVGGGTPSATQTIARATDGDPQTKWCLEHRGEPTVWRVRLAEPARVTGYAFTSANDVPGRDPRAWTLEGSRDGEAWVTIDRRADQPPFEQRHAVRRFDAADPGTYQWLRFTFPPNPGVPHFQLAEIAIDGVTLGVAAEADPPPDYRAELDLADATHTVTWTDVEADVLHTREALASHPARVVAWRWRADTPGAVSGELALTGAHTEWSSRGAAHSGLVLAGTLPNGLEYVARARLLAEGGDVSVTGNTLRFTGCDSVTVLLAAETSYAMDRGAGWRGVAPGPVVVRRLNEAVAVLNAGGWDALRDAHVADYRALFDRVTIDLGPTPDGHANEPVTQRIQRYRDGAQDRPRPALDPELEALLFQYGRYLLIASSREGTLPANLQGIWNNNPTPAWHSDYHSDINLQMNYWLAETANLPELARPMFDLLDASVPVAREATRREFGDDVPGFIFRFSHNIFGGQGWNWNLESTAWYAQHYGEHYAFSGDEAFLRERAWPWMRDVSLYWLDQLVEADDGSLLVRNSWSPEHGPHEDGTAHGQQLVWDLFNWTLLACEALDEDPALAARLRDAIDQLDGPRIGSWGQLMEWRVERPELEQSNHRHTSHLFAVFPGHQITADTPELLEAARVSLERRGEVGDSRRSWTWAWRTALWARLGQGDRAHGCVAGLLAHNTLPNLWTTHPPFQIDGNFGVTGGMCEVFVQSHAGVIDLLPALPDAWPDGEVTGLRVRGNATVDIAWADGRFAGATIHAHADGPLSVRWPGSDVQTIDAHAGMSYTVAPGE